MKAKNEDGAVNSSAINVSVGEGAKLIGISVKLTRRLIWDRKIPHIRIGRRVLIPLKALEEYLTKQTIPAFEPGGYDNAIL